ncbi:sugar-binding domain-containing protein [Congzhengia sp.]|uniref:glycoside hydrolase family 2 protein n=1 Tax=Congzhengia sp. TaxID=2944168 RepID=UPI00307825E2
MELPRKEYPRPQLVRKDWRNLNGQWGFEIDNAMVGKEKEFYLRSSLNQTITVPFCPESKLSGIENKDFMNCVWYRRELEIPKEWAGKEIILHFGAVDYHATVYINGQQVCTHKGGYTCFSANITKFLKESGNVITLCAEDDTRSGNQPCGKQSSKLNSYGCCYTRTTGIWQTVWMEAVDAAHIQNVKYTSNIHDCSVLTQVYVTNEALGCKLRVRTFFEGVPTGEAETVIHTSEACVTVALSQKHLWEAGKGNLYDTEIELIKDGVVCDSIKGYFGLREVSLKDKAFCLNGTALFGRWVLDQGFYPDGIYTAPSDEALKNDILYSMELGFNGARLHEKIFEPRFLYWADKLGYLVWGEHANWGLNITEPGQLMHFLPEWAECLERDYSHPSIIGWCPFNETWDWSDLRRQCDDILRTVYQVTKAIDKTRPVIDTSGNFHVITDIFDVHDYEQNPEKLKEHYKDAKNGVLLCQVERNPYLAGRQKPKGEPLFLSEYGGIRQKNGNEGWGYGEAPENDEAFIARYRGLTTAILDDELFIGFCYTQLYDVEQEINGLMTYDRKFKFDPKIFREINTLPAAIEKKNK